MKHLAIFLPLAFSLSLYSQTYTFTPGLTIEDTVYYNHYTYYDISIWNLDTVNGLIMTWDLLLDSFVTGWDYSLCDYGACYFPPLPLSSEVDTIPAGGKGFMKVNANPIEIPGTSIMKVYLYESSDPLGGDTLTWILTSALGTGIRGASALAEVGIFPNPASRWINIAAPSGSSASLYNITGQLLFRSAVFGGVLTIHTAGLRQGVYFLKVANGVETITRKVVIK